MNSGGTYLLKCLLNINLGIRSLPQFVQITVWYNQVISCTVLSKSSVNCVIKSVVLTYPPDQQQRESVVPSGVVIR